MRKYVELFILICALFPTIVFAQDYINQNGVVISESDYNNFKLIFTDARIASMDENEYNRYKSMNLDYNTLQSTTRYIKTTIDNVTGDVTNSYITQEEYESAVKPPQTRSTMIETAYKYIQLNLVRVGDEHAFFTFAAIWKIMPATRSFDVIGVRFSNMQVVNGTQQGKQIYKLVGSTSHDFVQYNFNGTNINNFDNGFGISMNLVNSDIESLESTIDSSMRINAFPAGLFTSYQHVVRNITLAQSKNYTIGAGLGSVFLFNDDIDAYYDGMAGVYDYFSS